jgi:hypothetical protein
MANVDVQAQILAWTAEALEEQAPRAGLHYYVRLSQDTTGVKAEVCVGWPAYTPISVSWSYADLDWPVYQRQVSEAVAGMLRAIGWPGSGEQPAEREDREGSREQPAGAALPGAGGDEDGQRPDDH